MAESVWTQLLGGLWSLASFLVAIIVLVTVHEFGHFWVARRVGVRVLRFSIGFGRPLLSWYDSQGTEYTLASIPFGGYVKMLDEREAPVQAEDLPRSFGYQPVWKRMLIVVAGPVANLLLALLMFAVLFANGEDGLSPVVGRLEPGSAAERAGLQQGQEIIRVDGRDTPTREAVLQSLVARIGDTGELMLAVRQPGDQISYELIVDLDHWLSGVAEPDPIGGLGFHFYLPPFVYIASVLPGSPAEQAGLKSRDVIEKMNEQSVADVNQWLQDVRNSAGLPLKLVVRREGVTRDIEVIPAPVTDKTGKTVGQIGAQVGSPPLQGKQHIRHIEYSLPQALARAGQETGRQTQILLMSLYKLVVGDLSAKNLSGPLGIAKVAGTSAEMGLAVFCKTLAILSVSLGVMNLLPVPVLDGGHLLLYLVEAVKGGPLSEKLQIVGNQVGLALLVSLMLFAVYNDLMKL
ncbi:MAG TPA: RIP metalloprotease RseP [Pseudomonadales bacterium]|nr:RIP metalloprotease RseP [Pseudomonadales bacterium]